MHNRLHNTKLTAPASAAHTHRHTHGPSHTLSININSMEIDLCSNGLILFLSLCRSRKRRTSFTQDNDMFMNSFRDDDQMDQCNAALVLMSLSGSPHSPRPWMLGSSPGSSSASWTSGSEELSDEGTPATGHTSNQHSPNRLRTASLSTSDEGIVMDYNDETPRKRSVSTIHLLFLFFFLVVGCCCWSLS